MQGTSLITLTGTGRSGGPALPPLMGGISAPDSPTAATSNASSAHAQLKKFVSRFSLLLVRTSRLCSRHPLERLDQTRGPVKDSCLGDRSEFLDGLIEFWLACTKAPYAAQSGWTAAPEEPYTSHEEDLGKLPVCHESAGTFHGRLLNAFLMFDLCAMAVHLPPLCYVTQPPFADLASPQQPQRLRLNVLLS